MFQITGRKLFYVVMKFSFKELKPILIMTLFYSLLIVAVPRVLICWVQGPIVMRKWLVMIMMTACMIPTLSYQVKMKWMPMSQVTVENLVCFILQCIFPSCQYQAHTICSLICLDKGDTERNQADRSKQIQEDNNKRRSNSEVGHYSFFLFFLFFQCEALVNWYVLVTVVILLMTD